MLTWQWQIPHLTPLQIWDQQDRGSDQVKVPYLSNHNGQCISPTHPYLRQPTDPPPRLSQTIESPEQQPLVLNHLRTHFYVGRQTHRPTL